MKPRSEHEARLSHPAAWVIMELIVVYAKRAAMAHALSVTPPSESWDSFYGIACAEEGLRDVLSAYVRLERVDIDLLRREALHVGQGAAAVAECKRAANALEAALRKVGLDERGEPLRAMPTRARSL